MNNYFYLYNILIWFICVCIQVCIADVQAELGAATCKKLEVTYPGCIIFVSCDITDDKEIEGQCELTHISLYNYMLWHIDM